MNFYFRDEITRNISGLRPFGSKKPGIVYGVMEIADGALLYMNYKSKTLPSYLTLHDVFRLGKDSLSILMKELGISQVGDLCGREFMAWNPRGEPFIVQAISPARFDKKKEYVRLD